MSIIKNTISITFCVMLIAYATTLAPEVVVQASTETTTVAGLRQDNVYASHTNWVLSHNPPTVLLELQGCGGSTWMPFGAVKDMYQKEFGYYYGLLVRTKESAEVLIREVFKEGMVLDTIVVINKKWCITDYGI